MRASRWTSHGHASSPGCGSSSRASGPVRCAAARISGSFREQPLVEASIRQTIGEAYQDLGLYAQARQHLERALDLRKNTLGENDRATLEILGNLAASYTLEGKYQRAEPHYRRVVDGLRRAYGDEDPEVQNALSEQAGLYR